MSGNDTEYCPLYKSPPENEPNISGNCMLHIDDEKIKVDCMMDWELSCPFPMALEFLKKADPISFQKVWENIIRNKELLK